MLPRKRSARCLTFGSTRQRSRPRPSLASSASSATPVTPRLLRNKDNETRPLQDLRRRQASSSRPLPRAHHPLACLRTLFTQVSAPSPLLPSCPSRPPPSSMLHHRRVLLAASHCCCRGGLHDETRAPIDPRRALELSRRQHARLCWPVRARTRGEMASRQETRGRDRVQGPSIHREAACPPIPHVLPLPPPSLLLPPPDSSLGMQSEARDCPYLSKGEQL